MGDSEVRSRVEPTIQFLLSRRESSEGVNHVDMSVKTEGSWPCVRREGFVGLTHRTQQGEGFCVNFPRPPNVAGTEFDWISWIATVSCGNMWLID